MGVGLPFTVMPIERKALGSGRLSIFFNCESS